DLLTYSIDNQICNGCGVCLKKCAVEAIVGEKGHAHYILDDKCIKCGMCYESCRFNAIVIN
ncbi:MAG: 4Fe-4S binding protein, partial [Ignavibacteriaceae bacterium]